MLHASEVPLERRAPFLACTRRGMRRAYGTAVAAAVSPHTCSIERTCYPTPPARALIGPPSCDLRDFAPPPCRRSQTARCALNSLSLLPARVDPPARVPLGPCATSAAQSGRDVAHAALEALNAQVDDVCMIRASAPCGECCQGPGSYFSPDSPHSPQFSLLRGDFFIAY